MSNEFINLDSLSPEEKELALKILSEMSSGKTETYNDLLYADYNEIPVDIETFLTDDRYLGNAWKDAEGNLKLYSFWLQTLKEIFPDNVTTDYNTLLETGARGIGKSEIACGCVGAYLMYRVMCLKNPLEYYHLKLTEKICFAFMNIKIALAEEIAISKFQKTIQMSPWFMNKGRMTTLHGNPYWVPPEPINIIIGSQPDDVIGQPIYFAFFDEISFIRNQDIDKQKKKAKDMIDTAIGGMFTRFIHQGKNPTMLVVASSKRSEQSFMESYIKTLTKTDGNNVYIVDKPVWEIKPKGTYSSQVFYVALGNKYLENLVIPDDDYINIPRYKERGYKILEVPIDFKAKFIEDIDRNLCDFAGVSSASSNKYFSAQVVMDAVNKEYKNPFPDILEIGNGPEDKAQYSDFFKLEHIPRELMSKPLYVHLDMSLSGDMTGIAGTWIIGKKPSTDENQAKDLFFRLAFNVSIRAPKGRQISFEKNRIFIRWLKSKGFIIKGITCDTYQSYDLLQQMSAEGYNCSVLSVDRVQDNICKPYQYLRSCIYEKRFIMYKSERLFDEFVDVERDMNSGKIDHTSGYHKDALDAVCGSVYNASQNAEQFAFDYGENIEAIIENNNSSDAMDKAQITIDFEEELKRSFGTPFERQNQNAPNQFIDFGMGAATTNYNANYLANGIVVW